MNKQIQHATPMSRLPQLTLFIILLRVLGVLPPDLDPVNFNDLVEASFVAETASSDIFNQLFWLSMGCLITIPIWRNPTKVLAYVRPLSLLCVFLAFCLLSAMWSAHPGISIRRSLLLIVGVYCVLGAVAYCPSPDSVLRIIYLAFGVVLALNLASLPLPFAFDNRGLLRGVTGDKNFLGVLAALGLFLGVAWRGRIRGGAVRALNAAYIAGWLIILPLTGAKTPIVLAIVAPGLALLLVCGVQVLRVSLPAVLVLVALILTSTLAVMATAFGMEPNDIVALFVFDVTFTGRDVIWEFILDQWEQHRLLGFGYGSFWGVGLDSPNLAASQSFIKLLTQSHNGYLDVALATGVTGLLIMVGFLCQVIALLDKAKHIDASLYYFGMVAIVFVLMHNLTESSLARGVATPWILLLCVSCTLTKAAAASTSGFRCARADNPAVA
jgi:exopolysaccharide production protein ExoQ